MSYYHGKVLWRNGKTLIHNTTELPVIQIVSFHFCWQSSLNKVHITQLPHTLRKVSSRNGKHLDSPLNCQSHKLFPVSKYKLNSIVYFLKVSQYSHYFIAPVLFGSYIGWDWSSIVHDCMKITVIYAMIPTSLAETQLLV